VDDLGACELGRNVYVILALNTITSEAAADLSSQIAESDENQPTLGSSSSNSQPPPSFDRSEFERLMR
jgi:hypothetical protein